MKRKQIQPSVETEIGIEKSGLQTVSQSSTEEAANCIKQLKKQMFCTYSLLALPVEIVATYFAFRSLTKYFTIVVFIFSLILLSLILCTSLRKAKKDAFSEQFHRWAVQNTSRLQLDEESQQLLYQAVKKRYQARVFLAIALLAMYHVTMMLIYTKDFSFLAFLLIVLMIEIVLIIPYALIIKKADVQLIQAVHDGHSKSALAMLVCFYQGKGMILKPMFNLHTCVVWALYEEGDFDVARRLVSDIKVRAKLYRLYI